MTQRTRDLVTIVAIGLGIALLAMTIANTDRAATWRALRPLAPALPLVLLPGAVWHLLRTLAWRQCFPADSRLRFGRLFRVRLAAEAFSFVTIRGVAGEPLKVIWLAPDVPSMVAAAAVALERAAYLVVTMAFVGVFSAAAMLTIPMPRAWMRVFAWLCGVSLVFAAALVLLMRRRPAPQAQGSPAGPSNVVARFGRQLAIQLRALGECDGRRLAVLAALEAASFGAMVMEVWVVLRLAGTPVSMGGAVTIETFTRAASTASAFIPANLGALEASNVAIAAAMNAAAGAAALAVARRIRGLAWCAAGFLIYPRRPRAAASGGAPVLVAIEDPASPVRVDSHLGGLPIGERICRAASRAGYKSVLVWSLRQTPAWKRIARRLASRLDVVAIDDAERWREYISSLDPDAAVTVLAPGVIASPACLRDALDRALTTNARLPLHVHAEAADSGVFTMMPAALRDPDSMFADECRSTSAVAAWQADAADSRTLRVAADQDRAAGERTLRASIIKPTDGPLARFNRRISIPISVALIRVMRMSAHAMSVGVIALGLYAGWLFSQGTYLAGVAAALVSLAASVLDGCDGELARLQYKESALGCWIDTFGDYTYYLAIFAGLTVGAVRQTGWPVFWWLGDALAFGVLMTFSLLILLRWRTTGGRPDQLRTKTAAHFKSTRKPWAKTAVWLAGCATRATMPYGILALAIVGLLPAVVVLATIGANAYWIGLARELRSLLRGSGASSVMLSGPRPDNAMTTFGP